MLQNAYFLAKIGADTAENEQHFAEILPIGRRVADRRGAHPERGTAPAGSRGAASRLDRWSHRLGIRIAKLATLAKFENCQFFCKILQIFGGLFLGCIKTKFCKKICVWQHFSSSTRFAYFCTAATSKI